jgi:ABC-type polar amino acid transport system ATPase subunit
MIGEVFDIVMGLAEAGMTMICVTHEMGFARRLANRMIFMDGGEIIEHGRPDDLFSAAQSDRLKEFLTRIMPAAPAPTR